MEYYVYRWGGIEHVGCRSWMLRGLGIHVWLGLLKKMDGMAGVREWSVGSMAIGLSLLRRGSAFR